MEKPAEPEKPEKRTSLANQSVTNAAKYTWGPGIIGFILADADIQTHQVALLVSATFMPMNP